jgi:hypothetical protein
VGAAESGGVVNIDTERLYARAFKHGAEAAMEFIASNWPDLAMDSDDYPSITKATMEHVDGVAALIADPFGTAVA